MSDILFNKFGAPTHPAIKAAQAAISMEVCECLKKLRGHDRTLDPVNIRAVGEVLAKSVTCVISQEVVLTGFQMRQEEKGSS